MWTVRGIRAAELMMRREPNTLFDDMAKQVDQYPKLRQMMQDILFSGSRYPFERDNQVINLGVALGFLREENGAVAISNRTFETKLYDLILTGKKA